jgi:hypothetical protein
VAASQCCCRHVLNGEKAAKNPLAGGNCDGGIYSCGQTTAMLGLPLRTIKGGGVTMADFVQRWILNFVIVYSLVYVR